MTADPVEQDTEKPRLLLSVHGFTKGSGDRGGHRESPPFGEDSQVRFSLIGDVEVASSGQSILPALAAVGHPKIYPLLYRDSVGCRRASTALVYASSPHEQGDGVTVALAVYVSRDVSGARWANPTA